MDYSIVGVVAAASVCGFFGIIIATFIGCFCGKRLETRKEIDKKSSTKQWVNGVTPLHASESEFSTPQGKLSSYQPKILGKSISQEQLIQENNNNNNNNVVKGGVTNVQVNQREHQYQRKLRRFSSTSDIRTSEINGKNISVVDVKGHHDGISAEYVYGHYSTYQNGGLVVPGYMIGNHIYPENPYKREVRQGQIVVGHHVAQEDRGVLVQGHQSSQSEVVRGHIVTNGGGVSSHIIKQNVEVDQDGKVVVTINNDAEERPRGLITPVDTAVEDSWIPSSEVVEVTSAEQIQSGSSTVVEVTEHHSQSAQAHVIRKSHHDDHAKLPRWMLDEQEHQSRTLSFGDEERTQHFAITTDTGEINNYGAVSIMNTGEMDSTTVSVIDNRQTREPDFIIEDYVDPDPPERPAVLQAPGIYQYTISDEVSGEQSTASRVITTTTTTTEVTKTTRQMVDESAEGVPPAFTSTPRIVESPALDEAQESVTTFVVGVEGNMVEDVATRRQMVVAGGDGIPLPPPPPPGFNDVQF